MTNNNNGENLGKILKQQRVMLSLTLQELAARSGVSPSHPGAHRERGEISLSVSSAKNCQATRF